MRLLAILTLLLISNFSLMAQVSNGGFESSSALPSNTGAWAMVDDWNNAGSAVSSPDYFHVNGTLGGDLPETPIAMVNAYAGNAIMGFTATGIKGSQFREYLSTELVTPLVVGQKYVVSFHVTNGYVTNFSTAGLGTSHLGACFTTSAPAQNNNEPLLLNPQFRKQTVLFNREWEEVSFSFIADQPYTHLTIGVFGDDADKTIDHFDGSNPQISYYFVDEVSITEVTSEVQEESDGKSEENDDEVVIELPDDAPSFFIPNAFTPNGDGDNDLFSPVIPDNLEDYRFCIYNRWGHLIFETTVEDRAWDGTGMSGGPVSTDMYVWELNFTRIDADGEKHKERHQGTVNLLR